jgi:hypothetical protein
MCADQPAQIDCRNITCLYHAEGQCKNVSPALSLIVPNGTTTDNGRKMAVTCWSYAAKNIKVLSLKEKVSAVLSDAVEPVGEINCITQDSLDNVAEKLIDLFMGWNHSQTNNTKNG